MHRLKRCCRLTMACIQTADRTCMPIEMTAQYLRSSWTLASWIVNLIRPYVLLADTILSGPAKRSARKAASFRFLLKDDDSSDCGAFLLLLYCPIFSLALLRIDCIVTACPAASQTPFRSVAGCFAELLILHYSCTVSAAQIALNLQHITRAHWAYTIPALRLLRITCVLHF